MQIALIVIAFATLFAWSTIIDRRVARYQAEMAAREF